MKKKPYLLKKHIGDFKYSDFEKKIITKDNLKDLNYIDFKLEGKPIKLNSDSLKLPEKSYKNLQSLLKYFSLDKFESEFLSFLIIAQRTYIIYLDEDLNETPLLKDFLNEKKELVKILDILELYLFKRNESYNNLVFKSEKLPSIKVKNFFTLDDIYNSILKNYGLNENNFFTRKKEILSSYDNFFDHSKGKEYINMKIIQSLFDFVKSNNKSFSDNEILKFCGVLLHICQIPSNKKNINELNIDSNIEDNLGLIDYQNLRHIQKGRLSFHIKN